MILNSAAACYAMLYSKPANQSLFAIIFVINMIYLKESNEAGEKRARKYSW